MSWAVAVCLVQWLYGLGSDYMPRAQWIYVAGAVALCLGQSLYALDSGCILWAEVVCFGQLLYALDSVSWPLAVG